MPLTRLRAAIRNLFDRGRADRELDAELRAYVDLLTEEHQRRGLTASEARRAALLEVRGADRVKERVRDVRAGHVVEQAWQDTRYGARMLRRNPGFAIVAILTLALGIGANTAIFSVLYAVLLKPLPYQDPGRLVEVSAVFRDRGPIRFTLSHANFWDVRDQVKAFATVGAIRFHYVSLTGFESPERIQAPRVSVGFLNALGRPPIAGRLFQQGEDEHGHDTHLAVLTEAFWQRRFGGDRNIVGRSLVLDGEPFRVIGVVPTDREWLSDVDALVPLVHEGNDDRGSFELSVIARLRDGITPDAAAADLARVGRQLERSHPEVNAGLGLVFSPSSTWLASDPIRRSLWLLMGAVGLLLLIACVNLSNMVLARASGRARETAMRTALGATRLRLVRQLLMEALLLAVCGTAAGVLLALWALSIVRTLQVRDLARLADVTVNGWALLFTVAIMGCAALLVAAIPALHTANPDLVATLRDGDRGVVGSRRQYRTRQALVVAEVALSLTLLVGAGLLLRSLDAVLRVDRGFQTAGRIFVSITLPPRYEQDATGTASDAFLKELLGRIRGLPSVVSASVVTGRPFSNGSTGLGFVAGDKPAPADVPWANWRLVTADYFTTMGVPLLRGRTFTEQDRARPNAVIQVVVSQRLADLLWPGENPLGRRIVLWKGQGDRPGEVIGVVGNMRERGLANDPTLAVYFSYYGSAFSPMQLVVHTTGSTEAAVAGVRTIAAQIDPGAPVSDPMTLDELAASSVASRRLIAQLLAAFAATALALALVGIYGVLSYAVSQRTNEIGVRMALGATSTSVLQLVVLQGLRPVAAGLIVGVVASLWIARVMVSLLFGVQPTDVVTYVAVALLLSGAATLACVLPARRAAAIEVTAALRAE